MERTKLIRLDLWVILVRNLSNILSAKASVVTPVGRDGITCSAYIYYHESRCNEPNLVNI